MALKPKHICNKPGCNNLTREGYCQIHKKVETKKRESAYRRGYDHHWKKARKDYLRNHPWCIECQKQGYREPATEVDHIIPHKGNKQLFWNTDNWQGLCKRCHSRKTAMIDGGFACHKSKQKICS